MILDLIVLIFLVVFFILFGFYEYYERKTGVPVFPTMPAVRKKIISLLQEDCAARPSLPSVIYDLGSGSGQLTWRIARALPQSRVVGIELSYIPWLRSVLRQRLFGPKNLSYKRLDFWPCDISDASAIVTYLPGKIMERVGEKLRKELKTGTLVIANGFALRAGWEPQETFVVRVPFKMKVFVYRQN